MNLPTSLPASIFVSFNWCPPSNGPSQHTTSICPISTTDVYYTSPRGCGEVRGSHSCVDALWGPPGPQAGHLVSRASSSNGASALLPIINSEDNESPVEICANLPVNA